MVAVIRPGSRTWMLRGLLALAAAVALPACVASYENLYIRVASTGATTVTIEWNTPVVTMDTGEVVPANSYELRYSTSAAAYFEEMTPVADGSVPAPTLPGGALQQATVTGLVPATTYYFIMRGAFFDEGTLYVSDSNQVEATTVLDLIAPGIIVDLATESPTGNSVTLVWTAPGDDGASGQAATYELRYSAAGPIDSEAAFAAATPVPTASTPKSAGMTERLTVTNLDSATSYWFALRAVDDGGNRGALSPVSPTALTLTGKSGNHGAEEGACGGSARPAASILLAALLILAFRV